VNESKGDSSSMLDKNQVIANPNFDISFISTPNSSGYSSLWLVLVMIILLFFDFPNSHHKPLCELGIREKWEGWNSISHPPTDGKA